MVVIAWVILLCACVRYILCDIAVRMRVSLAVRLVRAIGLLSRTTRVLRVAFNLHCER